MTTKADFTSEEWRLLLDTYMVSAVAVSMAGESGAIGQWQEMKTITPGRSQLAEHLFSDSPIILELANAAAEDFSGEIPGMAPQSENLAEFVRYYKDTALELCRRAAELVAEKMTAEDGQAYKSWVLNLGTAVAFAAEEGGHLGIGGVRYSEVERETLAEIAEALDYPDWQAGESDQATP
jgi:hypothetical protein